MSIREIAGITWLKGHLASVTLRRAALLLVDTAALALAFNLALLLHPGEFALDAWLGFWVVTAIVVLVKLIVFSGMGMYRISLSYLGLRDVALIIEATVIASVFFGLVFLWLGYSEAVRYSPSIIISDFLLTLVFIGGLRSSKRMYAQVLRRKPGTHVRRSLIAGAGSGGELILRALLQEKRPDSLPVGLVDDDPLKQGMTIHGVPVLGTREDIPRLVRSLRIDELLITMPSTQPAVIRAITRLGRQAGLKKMMVLPSVHSLINGPITVSDLRDIQVEDLLGREPVKIDTREIESYLRGKTVTVTGGAGSIGSELCQQIASFQPELLVVLDQDETASFNLRRELRRRYPDLKLAVVVGDIQDRARVSHTFTRYRPQVIFHSAAYKHVGMMEENPIEALRNNVLGTWNVGEAACQSGAEKFVLISTDKAVNPTSVMGATKRMAELVTQALDGQNACRFLSVRFGNVLGSRGSVVPIFREQIKRGGPVTITHPDMRRYFMTPSEAAVLVLQAGAIGSGGEIFVLDMGEPVSILDLARDMIQLAGLEPGADIPIVFTRPQPGEKLFEDILTAEEGTTATRHQRIFKARTNGNGHRRRLAEALERLQKIIDGDDWQAALKVLRDTVPNFHPSPQPSPSEERLPQPAGRGPR